MTQGIGLATPVASPDPSVTEHERRARFLDDLAVLVGCRESMGNALPDGRRPDVLRYNSSRRVLFIGDAKDSELPGCRSTQARLLGYFRWGSAHASQGGSVVFAICFGRRSDAEAWTRVLSQLASEAGLVTREVGVECFAPGTIVAWLLG